MINFKLGDFWVALDFVTSELDSAAREARDNDRPVDEVHRDRVEKNVQIFAADCLEMLQISSADPALSRLDEMFSRAQSGKRYGVGVYTYQQLWIGLQRLYEEIEHAAKQECFFHYPRELAKLVLDIPSEWKIILDGFPSSRREIETGIDCYAFGDYPGCVFHMVRIAELGLRTIARERGVKTVGKKKPIEWGTWQDVFQAIETQLKIVRQAHAGPKRDAAVTFYDTSLSDLRRLQGYRDPTMHFRATYDRGEAYDAMHRVKSLMQTLAFKLNETKVRRIRWGL